MDSSRWWAAPRSYFESLSTSGSAGMDSRSESGMTDRDYFWARASAFRMKSAVSWMRRWVSSIGSHQPV